MTASRFDTDTGFGNGADGRTPRFPRLRDRRNPRRYRRATLTTGRLQVLLAIALTAVLLAVLAVVVLPAPVSQVVVAVIVASALFLAIADNHHEDRVGR